MEAVPPNEVPLLPVDDRQTIDKLPAEPQPEIRFIPYEPPAPPAPRIPVRKPNLRLNSQSAAYMERLSELDTLENDLHSAVPTDQPTDQFLHVSLATPSDAFGTAVHEHDTPLVPVVAHLDVPKTFKQAIRGPRSDRWKAAMQKELDALNRNNICELCELPPGRKAFPNKWVFAYITGPKVLENIEKDM